MTSDSDDALTWDGDDDAPRAPRPTRRPSTPPREPRIEPATAPVAASERPAVVRARDSQPLSTAMLLTLGVIGGIYLLYSVGWVVGGLRLKPLANLIVADAMYVPWFVLAVGAPLLWFIATWVLTRGRAAWIRVLLLVLGIVLLVPWPFVTVGVIGS